MGSEENNVYEIKELCSVIGNEGDSETCSIAFDTHEELLWIGNKDGYVQSYHGPSLKKYTSFRARAKEPVWDLISMDSGIFSLTESTLTHHIRRGLLKFSFQLPNMNKMRCLIAMDDKRLLMGGHRSQLVDFDITTRKVIQGLEQSSQDEPFDCCVLKRHENFLVVGDARGKIILKDPITLKTEHSVELECGSLSDLDIQDDLLVACGCDSLDLITVFDVRTLRLVSPIAVPLKPLSLKFLPSAYNKLSVTSSDGKVFIVDPTKSEQEFSTAFKVPIRCEQSLKLDISSTGQAFGLSDNRGSVHLFSSEKSELTKFNNSSRDTEFPDKAESKAISSIYERHTPNKLSELFNQHFEKYQESLELEAMSKKESTPQDICDGSTNP